MAKRLEREGKLLEILKQREKLSTEEVTELLGVSGTTSRRIFIDLEKSGKIIRTFGGIHLVTDKRNSIYPRLTNLKAKIHWRKNRLRCPGMQPHSK